jgi:hypothetical protein
VEQIRGNIICRILNIPESGEERIACKECLISLKVGQRKREHAG